MFVTSSVFPNVKSFILPLFHPSVGGPEYCRKQRSCLNHILYLCLRKKSHFRVLISEIKLSLILHVSFELAFTTFLYSLRFSFIEYYFFYKIHIVFLSATYSLKFYKLSRTFLSIPSRCHQMPRQRPRLLSSRI